LKKQKVGALDITPKSIVLLFSLKTIPPIIVQYAALDRSTNERNDFIL
jgi:hypothetical protein